MKHTLGTTRHRSLALGLSLTLLVAAFVADTSAAGAAGSTTLTVRASNPGSLQVTVTSGGAPPPGPFRYVALGDSYSAGEGLAPFIKGTDKSTDQCHRSDQAYSQVAEPKAVPFVACSQQTTDAFWDSRASEPAQSLALNGTENLVTMTMGGNNLGWTKTLTDCTKLTKTSGIVRFSATIDANSCRADLRAFPDRIRDMKARLMDVYSFILEKSPRAQVRVLTYPPLFPDQGATACRVARIILPTLPPTFLQFDLASTVEPAFVEYEKQANAAIRQAVDDVAAKKNAIGRLRWVDTEAQFHVHSSGSSTAAHTISCGATGRPRPWINAVRFSLSQTARLLFDLRPSGRFGQVNSGRLAVDLFDIYSASFHPTVEGQKQMSAAMRATL